MKDGLFIAFGVALVLLGVGVIVVAARRQRTGPHIWAPRQDGAAVQRALRAGHAEDPRIDALARSAATDAIRQRWMLWFLPLGVLLFGAATVIDLRGPDTTWWGLGGSAAWTAITTIALVHQLVRLRRSRRYRERHPQEQGHP